MPDTSQKMADYLRAAQWRARRRKSPWNLLLFPVCFSAFLALWYALFQLVWAFHVAIYAYHHFADFWRRGISGGSFALSFLMVFALFPGTMALGFMLGNVLVWLIPAVRHQLDAEAQGYPGTSFGDAQRGLFKICAWTLPTGFAVALTAAYFLSSLR
jgi:hypothetical protein